MFIKAFRDPFSASELLMTRYLIKIPTTVVCIFLCAGFFSAPCAQAENSLLKPLVSDWGGHLRLRSAVSFPENDSRLDLFGHDRLHDGAVEWRLKKSADFCDKWHFDGHYELIGTKGETRKANQVFLKKYASSPAGILLPQAVSDDRRLMDLTRILSSGNDYLLYHRIDRLALSYNSDWGSVRIGRQALTWGNGFLFNPMDLFNPFSPTDVERDYKVGDDMVTAQVYTAGSGELQLLYVPRRNPDNHNVQWDESSVAAKYHFNISSFDIDCMAGKHYADAVAGVGLTGYLMDAAWRLDATYTRRDAGDPSGFASVAANVDYSWVWWGKNLYAWLEVYYTGLGESDAVNALSDPDILDRLARGERFTLGRSYMDAQVQVEWHPLVNSYVSVIVNTGDGSGILQPRVTVDPAQNLQVLFGANLYFGGTDTEFGGITIPGFSYTEAPADSVYLWLSWYY